MVTDDGMASVPREFPDRLTNKGSGSVPEISTVPVVVSPSSRVLGRAKESTLESLSILVVGAVAVAMPSAIAVRMTGVFPEISVSSSAEIVKLTEV